MCRIIDIKFTDEQVDYIITRVFEESENLDKLPIRKIFEILVDRAPNFSVPHLETENANDIPGSRARTHNEVDHEEEEEQDFTPMRKLDYQDNGGATAHKTENKKEQHEESDSGQSSHREDSENDEYSKEDAQFSKEDQNSREEDHHSKQEDIDHPQSFAQRKIPFPSALIT